VRMFDPKANQQMLITISSVYGNLESILAIVVNSTKCMGQKNFDFEVTWPNSSACN
jgi:hypothetical protein